MSKGRKLALFGTIFLVAYLSLLIFVYLVTPDEEKEAVLSMLFVVGTLSLPVTACTIYFWCDGDPDKSISPGAFIVDVLQDHYEKRYKPEK